MGVHGGVGKAAGLAAWLTARPRGDDVDACGCGTTVGTTVEVGVGAGVGVDDAGAGLVAADADVTGVASPTIVRDTASKMT